MGFFVQVKDNRVELDSNTQIEMMFKSLFTNFARFRTAYNLENKHLTHTRLLQAL